MFLSSPWNPVGPVLDRAAFDRLIAALRPGMLFVLDEAYFEFAGPEALYGVETLRGSGIPHVALRTFSKAYGLGGPARGLRNLLRRRDREGRSALE